MAVFGRVVRRAVVGACTVSVVFGGSVSVAGAADVPVKAKQAIEAKAAAIVSWSGKATMPIRCTLVKGGCYQRFENRDAHIYWVPEVQNGDVAFVVENKDKVIDKYRKFSFERGVLGYPTSDPKGAPGVPEVRQGGTEQSFQGGKIYYDNTAKEAFMVKNDLLGKRFHQEGGVPGGLAWPTSDPLLREGKPGAWDRGGYQRFRKGNIYQSNRANDKQAFIVRGAFLREYGAQGWETGSLGWPTSDWRRIPGEPGVHSAGAYQNFQRGKMYGSDSVKPDQVYTVKGKILDMYAKRNWENGLGFPLENQYNVPGGVAQKFQGGTLSTVPKPQWASPVPSNAKIRARKYYSSGRYHGAVDYSRWSGKIKSACTGTVSRIRIDSDHPNSNYQASGHTNYLWVDCGGGIEMAYAHWYKKDMPGWVKPGAKLSAGQEIVQVGNQGNSTGTHLHFVVQQNGNDLDGYDFLQSKGVKGLPPE